jgi:hypothetical protein
MQSVFPALACLAVLWPGVAEPAHADDQPFLTLNTTDIESRGGREVEQWLGWKTGETAASFNDFVSRTELEYGITDDLQGALYLNYEWQRVRSHLPPFSSDTESFAGVSGELIYRVLHVDFDPLGFALYVEPTWSNAEREIEAKILLQKNFLNDTLRCALNLNFEDDWERQDSVWVRQSALEFNLGAAYAIKPGLSAGLEFDNERAFEGLVVGAASREQASAFFLGPTIDYEPAPWKITLGAQAQLPWASSPAGVPGAVIDGFETHAERFRLGLRISRDF